MQLIIYTARRNRTDLVIRAEPVIENAIGPVQLGSTSSVEEEEQMRFKGLKRVELKQ